MIDLGSLAPLQVSTRLGRLRAVLADAELDALLVTSLTNVRYLTGFAGSAGQLLVTADDVVLITDGRYGDQAGEEIARARADARVIVGRSVAVQREQLADLVRALPSIGLEASNVSWSDQRALTALLRPTLVPTTGLVEGLRAVKDGGEVARIEAACDVASDALGIVFSLTDGEPTEEEFAWALEAEMRRLGASGPSFGTIVGTGANGALPHHRADHTRMTAGDLLVLDFGCVVDGYASDMTRTALVGGGEAASWQRELIEVATAAQAAGVAAVRPGLTGAEVDAVCRASINDAGLGDLFTHGTGHGVGLQIHEAPWVLATATEVLQPGNVITVEPGVYRVGLGGVRVEDTVLVTADGCRPLTKTPKDLACLRSPRTT